MGPPCHGTCRNPAGPCRGCAPMSADPQAPWPGTGPKLTRATPGPHGPALTRLHLQSGFPKPGCQAAVPGSSSLSCPTPTPLPQPTPEPPTGRAHSLDTSLHTHSPCFTSSSQPGSFFLLLPTAAIFPGRGLTDTSPPPQTVQRGRPGSPSPSTAELGPESPSGFVQ